MSAHTFLQTLAAEVARMQALYPDREGELARAHALILHGLVVPSPDDPTIGQVLSSDASTVYHVNGSCDCQAGQHGKGCKHVQAWKLYRYIAGKVETQRNGDNITIPPSPQPLYEAPASLNLKVLIAGHEVMVTLRGGDETRLIERLHALLKRPDLKPVPKPASTKSSNWKQRGR